MSRNPLTIYVIAAATLLLSQTTLCSLASAAPIQINVKSWGVKCDGLSDDAPALNAGLTANKPAAGHAVVAYFPASTTACLLGAPISVYSRQTLKASPGTVVIAPFYNISNPYPNGVPNPLLVSISNQSFVTVSGIVFDGNVLAIGNSNTLITVYGADHVLFEGVTVQNSRGMGILFSGGGTANAPVTNSGTTDSHFNNIGAYYLISGDLSDRQQSTTFCCGLQDSNGNWNNHGNFANHSSWGINGFDNLNIADQNYFSAAANIFHGTNNGANIYCASSNHLLIVGNIASGAAGNGIDCFLNDHLVVEDNVSSANGGAGIQAADTYSGLIENNTVMNNFQSSRPAWANGTPVPHPGSTPSTAQGGITIEDAEGYAHTTNMNITRNTSGNTRPTAPQSFGIQIGSPMCPIGGDCQVRNLVVKGPNNFVGNKVAAVYEYRAP